MKNVLLSVIILCFASFAVSAEPTCKEQVRHVKKNLKALEQTINQCQKEWEGTCNAAISANHEAVLAGLDYASQICPVEWTATLERIKEELR